MKVTYDRLADAASIRLGNAAIARTKAVAPGVNLDLDAEGRVVAIEVLDVSLLPGADCGRIEVQMSDDRDAVTAAAHKARDAA